MPIEFKPLPMMTLRSSPGEILDRVSRHGESFVIERSGQQLACLVPISIFLPDVDIKRINKDCDELREAGIDYSTSITSENEICLRLKREEFLVRILMPHGYPSNCPKIFAEPIDDNCPHQWQDGSLCIFGAIESWNPGNKNLLHVLELTEGWLKSYKQWKQSGKWTFGITGEPSNE